MTEVMTATIPGCSVDDFLEMIVPRATRIKSKITREVFTRSAPFGLLRALGYRPDARAIPRIPIASNNKNDPSSTMPASMKAVTIEQYHSCTVDDESPDVNLQSGDEKIAHKATLRSKIYTLSIPYSNCFSIEVVVDIEDVQSSDDNMQEDVTTTTSQREISITASSSGKSADSEHTEGIERKSALRIRWRAGVVFSRSTMLRAEIEQGALEGIKSTCTAMLKTLTLRRDKKRPSSTLCLNKETQPLSRDKKRPPSGLGQQKECKPRDTKARRLEFGMKLFIPALPEGSQFTIEVLVIVEPAEDDPSSNILRVLFASPPRHRRPAMTPQQVTLNSAAPHIRVGFRREEARACSSAAFISTADAHGQMLVPTNRQITAKFRKDGGTLSQAGDEELQYSPIELLSQRKQKDFPEAKTFSVMNGCRGTVYEAGNTNITTLKPGADFDVEWIIQAPHPGTMKLSIVKPSTDSSGKIMYKNYKTILTLDSFAQNGGTGSTTATMPTGVLVLNMQL
ncbi:hypothetical protein JM16_007752 [Phytophthora kernoviae]|uniref:Chitin-binding type-4 domain-containing protein n=1 Tax=Phytophthora kernoviae TaxID=325452 RepID=A0A8T0LPS9_9STRA|nr:hypothetical protein JM16_007752 [Phytophthora kernoviae]